MKRKFMQKIYNYVGQRLIAESQSSLCRDCNIINKQAPRHQISDEKIDLVDLGRIKAFMFMDDLIYDQFIAESSKHYDIKRIVSERLPPYHRKNLSKVDSTNVIEFVSHHYVANGLDFTFIDVGCNNGADALAIADFFSNENIPAKIIAFEPGSSGYLVEHNIQLNGFHDKVQFEPLAVSCHSLPTIIRIQVGHSEDNRIVNLSMNSEADVYNRIVDTTTIDSYCSNNKIKNHLIVKTDTQGGDYDVIMGMKGVIAERLVTFITEFAPSLISSSVKPIDFLNLINGTHYIFDIGWYRFKKTPINRLCSEDFDSFIDRLNKSNDWTDIIAIPRRLPEINKLLQIFQ